MLRIDTTDIWEKRKYGCPHPRRHVDWRVVDGLFECRSCGRTYREIVDKRTGEYYRREDVELVGTEADSKGAFGRPTVE